MSNLRARIDWLAKKAGSTSGARHVVRVIVSDPGEAEAKLLAAGYDAARGDLAIVRLLVAATACSPDTERVAHG